MKYTVEQAQNDLREAGFMRESDKWKESWLHPTGDWIQLSLGYIVEGEPLRQIVTRTIEHAQLKTVMRHCP